MTTTGDIDVVFRCDAGAHHGLGHLSRCLTVAEAGRAAGWRAAFVVHAPDDMRGRVTEAGWPVRLAAGPVGDPADRPDTWLPSTARVLVIDSKAATAATVASSRGGAQIVCFDDEEARDLPCDLLVNNHLWARPADYPPRPGRRLLLGPGYNTVRAQYFEPSPARHGLLITLGGEDPHNHTAWLVDTLADLIGDLPTIVCVGPAHPAPASVAGTCRARLPRAEVMVAPPSLVGAVARCHLALSAAGTTCYELAAAGVAFGVLAVEAHQDRMADAIVESGAAARLGRFDDLTARHVRGTFMRLTTEADATAMAAAGRRLVARPGAPQIVAAWQVAA